LLLTRRKSLKTIERQSGGARSRITRLDLSADACSRRRQIPGICGNRTVAGSACSQGRPPTFRSQEHITPSPRNTTRPELSCRVALREITRPRTTAQRSYSGCRNGIAERGVADQPANFLLSTAHRMPGRRRLGTIVGILVSSDRAAGRCRPVRRTARDPAALAPEGEAAQHRQLLAFVGRRLGQDFAHS